MPCPPLSRPLVEARTGQRRVGSRLSLASQSTGDRPCEPEDFEGELVMTGLCSPSDAASMDGDRSRHNSMESPMSIFSEETLNKLLRTETPPQRVPSDHVHGGLKAKSCSVPWDLGHAGGADSPGSQTEHSSNGMVGPRGGWPWFSSLVMSSLSSPAKRLPSTPSLEHSPASVFSAGSSFSRGLPPAAYAQKCVRELANLLKSPRVTKVIVLLGAGASQESHLETYVNMEKNFFYIENGRLTSHPTKPSGVSAFTYLQLFGPLHSWQDPDELQHGLSSERFAAFKRVSDAFCADMVEKFSKAEPHQGYLDLAEVLAAWKAGALEQSGDLPGHPDIRSSGKQAQTRPLDARELVVATTNLDKLAVKSFRGVADVVHEMHGDIDFVRKHRIPLRGAPGGTGASPPKKPSYAGESNTEGFVHKPLVMHFEEQYYSSVPCRRVSSHHHGAAAEHQDSEPDSCFTFKHMKKELKEFIDDNAEGTVVLEIGCSNRVRAIPALRESLLKRGATVFVINPAEKSSRLKQRLVTSQPMLMSKLANLRVVPSGFGELAGALRWEMDLEADGAVHVCQAPM